jgi:5-methylcytosine-specific restriction endonuclease McrA
MSNPYIITVENNSDKTILKINILDKIHTHSDNLKIKFSSKSFICGKPFCFFPLQVKTNKGKLEIDHIIPKSKGGVDKLENYQALCNQCNKGKSNKFAG